MTEPSHPYRPLPPDFLAALFRDPLDPGYADAAGRPPPPPGRRRVQRVVTVLVLVATGVVAAVAYQRVVAEESARAQVRAELEDLINDRQATTDALEERAAQLSGEVSDLTNQQLGDPQLVAQLREQEAMAGLAEVRGDGAVVEVADGPPEVDPATGEEVVNPDARVIYRDLQLIVNALWAAGAEAVAINGRRLGATSTIRNAGAAILVDRRAVLGPYRVAAIGPADLRERFDGTGVADLLRRLAEEVGIRYEVRSARDLRLPAATAPPLEHATPVSPDGNGS